MDLATLIGIFSGLSLVIGAIMSKPGSAFFFDPASFFIVAGGTMGATLINYPLRDVLSVFSIVKKVFSTVQISYTETIESVVSLAEKARREGILAIEREMDTIDDDFLKSGIQHAVDGTEPETIRAIMETELSNLADRHLLGMGIFIALSTYAPAFGMIGTLIGLIQMLQGLDDPSQIGAGMATALVTTFYGAISANLFFLPMAGKLNKRSKEEMLQKELVVEGILAIQSGDNPRLVRERLLTYLEPAKRLKE